MSSALVGLSFADSFLKRTFDLFFSLSGLFLFGWLIILAAALARIDTGLNGFFMQQRIGRNAKIFSVIKIRTMKPVANLNTAVTTSDDIRITTLGKLLRKAKIDELPQLVNVLLGQMSFVGPRPDVPGFADRLKGEDRAVLSVRPGITGPATLKYRNEEELLASVNDSEAYNNEVIYPDKVSINLAYIKNYSLSSDIKCILSTILNR